MQHDLYMIEINIYNTNKKDIESIENFWRTGRHNRQDPEIPRNY